jgi:arylsulfatase
MSSADAKAIVLITADELLRESLSCYGNEAISTPNLDALAAEGTRFDAAYTASPWCLPARCAMLTGLLPHNSGAYSNFRPSPIGDDLPNLYTTLKGLGYTTAHVGKCHYLPVPYSETQADKTLPYEEFREKYMALGMDHLALQDDKQVSVWFYDDFAKELDDAGYLEAYRDSTWLGKKNGRVFEFPGPADWHPDSWVGRKSVEYLAEYQDDRPAFLWASFSGPHYPFDPPAEYLDRVDMSKDTPRRQEKREFDDPSRIHYTSYNGSGGIDGCGGAEGNACKNYTEEYWTDLRRHYYANVLQIDEWVGKILRATRERFGDEALIMFTADHGEMLGNHGLWGKNNCAYEEVWGIPLLVKYPAAAERKPSAVESGLVSNLDVMASCLSVAGGPDVYGDGQDYRRLCGPNGHRHVIAEGEGFVAVTDGTLKLVRVQQPPRRGAGEDRIFDELYDRSIDPFETQNMIDKPEYSSRVAELRSVVLNKMMGDLLP